MNNSLFFKKHLNKYKYIIGFTLFINLILTLINLSNTYITGKYIDLLISSKSMQTIYIFSATLFILGLSNILFGNINTFISAKLQANMVFDINFEVIQHVKKLPIKFFKNLDSVYLNQRINGDANTIVNFIISMTVQVIIHILTFIIVLYILKEKNSTLSLLVLISIPIYLLIYIIFEKKLYKSTLSYKEEQNKFFSKMNKQLSNISFIKLNSLFDSLDKELLQSYPIFLKSVLKYIKCNYYFSSVGSIIDNIFNIILFLYGGIAIYKNKMTIGDFIIIQNYYLLLLQSISYLTSTLKSYPEVKVCYNRVLEILNTDIEENGKILMNSINSINLKNINLKFDNKTIINNFNYLFEKGKVYIIKGENGVGKSTLIKLILGLYIDEFHGNIFYNDFNIKDINIYDSRKRLISIIDQEPLMIHSDLYENITQNIDNMDYKSMNNLIDTFNLNGLNYNIDQELNYQKVFSGGEKQKISIIRSLLKNPDVIVMDEPTSALDINSTKILIDKIKKLKSNKIIIIISHDKRLDCISDEIIQLKNSSELIEKNSSYI